MEWLFCYTLRTLCRKTAFSSLQPFERFYHIEFVDAPGEQQSHKVGSQQDQQEGEQIVTPADDYFIVKVVPVAVQHILQHGSVADQCSALHRSVLHTDDPVSHRKGGAG